ncbi:MAG: hypothetical protein M1305_04935 [Candidatus Marsarchaeota archaeon]|nr:hypothetical protein [Candidatus Marsarchaeota archaeon]
MKSLHLDLIPVHCSQLILLTQVSLEEPKIDTLREVVKAARQQRDWPWLFGESYEIDDRQYALEAWLRPKDEVGQELSVYSLEIEFSIGTVLYRRPAPVRTLFEVVGNSPSTTEIACQAHFHYSEDDGSSLVPLPITTLTGTLPSIGDVRFEIRGLRLTMVDERGDIDYSVVVDRPRNSIFHHNVSFRHPGPVSASVPQVILGRAHDISCSLFGVGEKAETPRPTRRKKAKV